MKHKQQPAGIAALGFLWPFCGRHIPPGKIGCSIQYVHKGWMDLCWWCTKRDVWVYVSTLPLSNP